MIIYVERNGQAEEETEGENKNKQRRTKAATMKKWGIGKKEKKKNNNNKRSPKPRKRVKQKHVDLGDSRAEGGGFKPSFFPSWSCPSRFVLFYHKGGGGPDFFWMFPLFR